MACGSSLIKLVQNELQALHLFHEAGKAGLVEDSHIGKNLTVQSDVSLLQAVHEHAVGHAVGASAGIDTSDPQATENALLIATVTVSVLTGLHHRLLGNAENIIATKNETLGEFHNLLMTSTSGYTTFYSGHLSLLLIRRRATYDGWTCCQSREW